MSPAGIFIVLLAFVLANVPFLTQRMLGCLPIPRRCEGVRKHLGWQLAELLAFYCIVGAVSRVLEARAGAVFSQRWPFYVVTFCLFLIFAAPGFTVYYLLKPPHVNLYRDDA
ncbi:conserved membrane hypothetical protein [Candidatus Glomeribacter gigasporarum BEG34]|uniref:Transmembrane protein n=1 Tax=Candidatus Glomeribacter gigasporarum BEG34 TaxID=1070319 RepID=G2J8M4_9BURK|nr:DUF2818 family protein [Candidatus Glomeribacter gigasporarum]CCD29121.1 conserved membrane hypothetical protein [Candidatus Glomeribacter gigasporarum BEG34]